MKRSAMVALLLLPGCSTFDRDFRAPLVFKTTAESGSDLVGKWEGTWTSDDNGHEGSLRCIITRTNSTYEARYYATYEWFIFPFSFEYVVPMTAVREGGPWAAPGAWKLRGRAELSCWIAGGLYEYEARVEDGEYVATYRSDFDRGVFKMKRVW